MSQIYFKKKEEKNPETSGIQENTLKNIILICL